jgi:hypothetical protein
VDDVEENTAKVVDRSADGKYSVQGIPKTDKHFAKLREENEGKWKRETGEAGKRAETELVFSSRI